MIGELRSLVDENRGSILAGDHCTQESRLFRSDSKLNSCINQGGPFAPLEAAS